LQRSIRLIVGLAIDGCVPVAASPAPSSTTIETTSPLFIVGFHLHPALRLAWPTGAHADLCCVILSAVFPPC
jgi:hypothetical protein